MNDIRDTQEHFYAKAIKERDEAIARVEALGRENADLIEACWTALRDTSSDIGVSYETQQQLMAAISKATGKEVDYKDIKVES